MANVNLFQSIAGYRVYLASMLQLYDRFEESLSWSAGAAKVTDLVGRLKGCLRDDLEALDVDDVVSDAAQQFDSNESKWATSYVMEGASMGAKYVLRSIEAKKDRERFPTSYLETLVNESKDRWPKYVAALDNADCDHELAVDAALHAFDVAWGVFETNVQTAGLKPSARNAQ